MIEVHLYSELRRYGNEKDASKPSILYLPTATSATIHAVLEKIGTIPGEVAQIFLNYKLLQTSCSMAPWLGYQEEKERLPQSGNYLETQLQDGDRIGLFPHKMALLVV